MERGKLSRHALILCPVCSELQEFGMEKTRARGWEGTPETHSLSLPLYVCLSPLNILIKLTRKEGKFEGKTYVEIFTNSLREDVLSDIAVLHLE